MKISFAVSHSARAVTVHMSNMMNTANIHVAGPRDTLIVKSLPPFGSRGGVGNIDAVAMHGSAGDQYRRDGGAVAGEDADTEKRGVAVEGVLADVATLERDGKRPRRHHSACGERFVNQAGAADRDDPNALGQKDPVLCEASSGLELQPNHQLVIPGNHFFQVGMDPDSVAQVPIARDTQRVALGPRTRPRP